MTTDNEKLQKELKNELENAKEILIDVFTNRYNQWSEDTTKWFEANKSIQDVLNENPELADKKKEKARNIAIWKIVCAEAEKNLVSKYQNIDKNGNLDLLQTVEGQIKWGNFAGSHTILGFNLPVQQEENGVWKKEGKLRLRSNANSQQTIKDYLLEACTQHLDKNNKTIKLQKGDLARLKLLEIDIVKQAREIFSLTKAEDKATKLEQLFNDMKARDGSITALSFGREQQDASEFLGSLLNYYYKGNLPISLFSQTKPKDNLGQYENKDKKTEVLSKIELEIDDSKTKLSEMFKTSSEEELSDIEFIKSTSEIEGKTERIKALKEVTTKINSDVNEFCISLKRFNNTQSGDSVLLSKKENEITLDDITINNEKGEEQNFTPTAFIVHSGGNSIKSGHYVAYVREIDDREGGKEVKYFRYNDGSKTEVSKNDYKDVQKAAYIVKYSKIHKNGVDLPKFSQNPTGIKNLGSTCWANSTMALFASMVNEKTRFIATEEAKVKPVVKPVVKDDAKPKEDDFTINYSAIEKKEIKPATSIKVTYYAPALKENENIWQTKVGEEFISNNRKNNYRVIDGVYEDEDKIKNVFKQIIANCAEKYGLKNDEVQKIIHHAKANGGVAYKMSIDNQKYAKLNSDYSNSDNKLESVELRKAKNFSAMFQRECESLGIYTGRTGKNLSVGLRLTFLPDDVVKELDLSSSISIKSKNNFNADNSSNRQQFVDKNEFKQLKEKVKEKIPNLSLDNGKVR